MNDQRNACTTPRFVLVCRLEVPLTERHLMPSGKKSHTRQDFWSQFSNITRGIYGQPLSASDGFSESKVVTAERRLGRKFPTVLREFYRRAAARQDDFNVREFCCSLSIDDVFLDEDEDDNEPPVIVFAD